GDGDQRGGPRWSPPPRDLPARDRRLAGDDEQGLERRVPDHRHAQVEPRGHAPSARLRPRRRRRIPGLEPVPAAPLGRRRGSAPDPTNPTLTALNPPVPVRTGTFWYLVGLDKGVYGRHPSP